MENASDALKMAGAMLLFVGALSVAIFVLSKARLASASIMAKHDASRAYYSVENVNSEKVVGIDTVIANMYNYFQTQNTILFYKKNADGTVEPVKLYYSEASDKIDVSKQLLESTLDKATLSILNATKPPSEAKQDSYRGSEDKRSIFGIDVHDELIRQEPWTRNEETHKQFVDALINRKDSPGYDISYHEGTFNAWGNFAGKGNVFKIYGNYYDDVDGQYKPLYKLHIGFVYDFDGEEKPLINMKNAKFIERIGIYNYEAFYNTTHDDDSGEDVTTFDGSDIDPSLIYFNETNETIENKDGEKKTVIEYIYIGTE